MRTIFLLGVLLALPLLAETPAPRANDATTAVLEKLRALEHDILSHAAGAAEKVRKAHQEARDITAAGEKRAKEIRDEAEAYTKKVEREIAEIQKGMPGHGTKSGIAPSRAELAYTLDSLVDPMLGCWSTRTPFELKSCLWERLQEGLRPRLQTTFPKDIATCRLGCTK